MCNTTQLGDGTTTDKAITVVELDNVVTLLGVGPSAESAFFYTEYELVFGTGLNSVGQLGVGDKLNRSIPSQVQFQKDINVELLSASEDLTVMTGTLGNTFQPTVRRYFSFCVVSLFLQSYHCSLLPLSSTPTINIHTSTQSQPSTSPSESPSMMPSFPPSVSKSVSLHRYPILYPSIKLCSHLMHLSSVVVISFKATNETAIKGTVKEAF